MAQDAPESVTDAGTSVLDIIRANPIPAAMIGLGLGWLIFGARGNRSARGAGRRNMRAERGIESTLEENPLAIGAVAVAIGAAVGLSLPSSPIEDEWMGDAMERLLRPGDDGQGPPDKQGPPGQQGQRGPQSQAV